MSAAIRTNYRPFSEAFCLDRECVYAAVKLSLQRGIDKTVLLDSRFTGKGRALDPDPEMRFDAARMNAGMASVLIGLIDHIKPAGLERFR